MLGMLVGSFVFGFLSDMLGRKSTLMISTIVMVLGGTISSILPADPGLFTMFAICRFISGCGHVGTFMMAFGLTMEYCGPSKRVLCGCLIETPFSLGGLIVGLLSWGGVRNWRNLQMICTTPWLLLLTFWWLVPESPRWLLAKG